MGHINFSNVYVNGVLKSEEGYGGQEKMFEETMAKIFLTLRKTINPNPQSSTTHRHTKHQEIFIMAHHNQIV